MALDTDIIKHLPNVTSTSNPGTGPTFHSKPLVERAEITTISGNSQMVYVVGKIEVGDRTSIVAGNDLSCEELVPNASPYNTRNLISYIRL